MTSSHPVAVISAVFFFLQIVSFAAFAQDTIYIDNPSFEDFPHRGTHHIQSIEAWYDCGSERYPGETPPDIHPTPDSAWGVVTLPYQGNTYLGLSARGNETTEAVAQVLRAPLKGGKCYAFSVFLARSDVFMSWTRWNSPPKLTNFTSPVAFVLYGGDYYCDRREKLAKSPPIDHSEWKEYNFVIQIEDDYNFIEVGVEYDGQRPVNGHILVDNLSPFIPVHCNNNE